AVAGDRRAEGPWLAASGCRSGKGSRTWRRARNAVRSTEYGVPATKQRFSQRISPLKQPNDRHSERSEESCPNCPGSKILRCAQNDGVPAVYSIRLNGYRFSTISGRALRTVLRVLHSALALRTSYSV